MASVNLKLSQYYDVYYLREGCKTSMAYLSIFNRWVIIFIIFLCTIHMHSISITFSKMLSAIYGTVYTNSKLYYQVIPIFHLRMWDTMYVFFSLNYPQPCLITGFCFSGIPKEGFFKFSYIHIFVDFTLQISNEEGVCTHAIWS